MKNDWNSHPLEGVCIYCKRRRATDRHHALMGKNTSKKARKEKLTNHLNSFINLGPSCHECNVDRSADNQWEVSFNYAVDTHGLDAVLNWVDAFPQVYKVKGGNWELLDRKVRHMVKS